MSKKTIFIGLVLVAIVFIAGDFFLNNYKRFLINFLEDQSQDEETDSLVLYEVLKDKVPENVVIGESTPTSTLFSRLDISMLGLRVATQTPIMDEIMKFGVIYELSGGEALYFQLKSALELVLEEDDSVFDANNLGEYALYYNDAKRPDDVFLLSLIQGRVWGFEYPKKNHEIFKKLTKSLVEESHL